MYREKLKEKFRLFLKRSSISFKQPIFIWGMPRGGTTLLQDLLYLSDDLESFTIREKRYKKGIWGHLHYGENVPKSLVNRPSPVEGFPRLWLRNNVYQNIKKKKILSSDKKKIILELKKIKLEWFFKTNQKKRILEKSPNYVMILDYVNDLFPDSFHICVIRDPRAVINSFARLIKYTAKETAGKELLKGDKFLKFPGYQNISKLNTYRIFTWQMEQIIQHSINFKKKIKDRLFFWYHEYTYEDLHFYLEKLCNKLEISVPEDSELIYKNYIFKNNPWWKNKSLKKKRNIITF